MDTSETIKGKREWAPAEGVTDSDLPTRSAGKKCRTGDLRRAFVAGKEVVREDANCVILKGEKRSIRSRGRAPVRRVSLTDGDPCYLRGLLKSATAHWGGTPRRW